PYLVMPFVDGPTLRQACEELDLRGKVEVLLQTAEALHACHRAGIVHRDVKPGNVMLQRTEDGGWHAFLMDFGVARDLSDVSRTRSQAIMGTPMYLSPEQAQGQPGKVDRRSDVYALGTLLYECLTGAPPFVDESPLALLRRIAEDDPVPPSKRAPDIPADLQTIVLKALEKDPARRYDSARAFGEDLRRFLDGEPILARRPSLLYRARKRLRKNRLVAALLAALLLAAGYGTFSSLRSRAQLRAAQQLAQEVERLDGRIFQVRSLPRHDASGELKEIRQALARLQGETAQLGRWAQGPARLALGRGYLALGDLEKARTQLEAARRAAPTDPDVAQALGATLARLYVGELEGLRGQALEERRREIDPTLKRPALALLQEAQGRSGEGSAYAQGLLALVQGDLDGALAKAAEAQVQQPWYPEPWLLEAEARKERAVAYLGANRRDLASVEMDREGACLAAAQDRARSAPEPLVEEAQRRFALLSLKLDQGQATAADRDWALEPVRLALDVDPGSWRALSFGTAIHRRWATRLIAEGRDPGAELDAAASDAENALSMRPDEATLWVNWATVLRNRAELTLAKGGDPEPFLARAEAGLQKALQQPRLHDYLYDGLGNIHALRAERQLLTGQDPTAEVNAAAQALEAASTLRPWVGHDFSEGAAYQTLARYKVWTGADPRPALDLAVHAHRRGLSLQPASSQSQIGLAEALLDRAEAALEAGQPDPPSAEEARHLMETLCGRQPRNADAVAALARARFLEARASRSLPDLRAALALQRQAVALAPQNADLRLAWGEMALEANRELHLPADPAALKALAALAQARPWDGWTRLLAAEGALRRGRDAEARTQAQVALRLNPALRREAGRRGLI
ncbi:MAG TPA: protein kinase, partial [Holophagaceae bacterium]|nr:protein kinase [Holophagaceae bacterium]